MTHAPADPRLVGRRTHPAGKVAAVLVISSLFPLIGAPASAGSVAEIGTCRSEQARAEVAAAAPSLDWIQLGAFLGRNNGDQQVVEVTGLELGPTLDAAEGEGIRQVRFTEGRNLTDGTTVKPSEGLMNEWVAADADAALRAGHTVVVRTSFDGQYTLGTAGVSVDHKGTISFLGDCVPAWGPVTTEYAHDHDLESTALVASLLRGSLDPVTEAFLRDEAAATFAGPLRDDDNAIRDDHGH